MCNPVSGIVRYVYRLLGRSQCSGMSEVDLFDTVRHNVGVLSHMAEVNSHVHSGDAASDNRIEDLLAKGLPVYGHELDAVRWWARLRNEPAAFPETGMYDWIEAQILYVLIRCAKPKLVVEISPHHGYSTGFILLAMNKNDRGRLFSFDLEQTLHKHAARNFERAGIDSSRQQFYAGDVRDTCEAVLPGAVDLLFVDSDHSYAFAEWYIANLYPRVAQNGLIHAHDVLKYGVRPHLGDRGEGKALWEFIQRRQIPETHFFYVAEFVRNQPVKPDILQAIQRYPFGDTSFGTNSVEQNASLWMVKRF